MSPAELQPRPAAARAFTVLVVGRANLRRSPEAARLLQEGLADGSVTVHSAGTHPVTDGEPADPATDQPPRALDDDVVRGADLVLTTTRAERAEVVRRVPSALRRTFTLNELARAARTLDPADLPQGSYGTRLQALVGHAALHRGRTETWTPADDDLPDSGPDHTAARGGALARVHAAVGDLVAAVLASRVEARDHDEPDPRPEPEETEPEARRRLSRAQRVAIVTLSVLAVLVAALAVGVLLVLRGIDGRIERFDDPFAALPTRAPAALPDEGATTGARAVTVLVLGSTDDVSTDGTADWTAAADVTDAVLLLHVTADRRAAQVVALPPDLQVQLPGGATTLRAAFAAQGPAGAVQAVEALTQVRLDHVALTDRATFSRVTESLGGVHVDVPQAVVVDGRVVLPAGEQRLTGEEALLWVQGDGDHDPERTEREQTWLRAILDRLGERDVRADPRTWVDLVGVVAGSVAVDDSLDRSTLVSLVSSMRSLRPADVDLVSAPVTVDDDDVEPDTVPFDALMDALRDDTLADHLAGPDSGR